MSPILSIDCSLSGVVEGDRQILSLPSFPLFSDAIKSARAEDDGGQRARERGGRVLRDRPEMGDEPQISSTQFWKPYPALSSPSCTKTTILSLIKNVKNMRKTLQRSVKRVHYTTFSLIHHRFPLPSLSSNFSTERTRSTESSKSSQHHLFAMNSVQ